MFPLRLSRDWAAQVQAIRDATTEDARPIRFDNAFYRICRPGTGTFGIHLLPRPPNQPGVRIDPALRGDARTLKVIKRPG